MGECAFFDDANSMDEKIVINIIAWWWCCASR